MPTPHWIDFWLVDAFTTEPFQGNPSGVVLDADGLSTETMRLIAREVGAPETAFVFPPEDESADVSMRWFTSTCEVPFSGHGTVSTLHVLAAEGRFPPPTEPVIETLAGPMRAWICPSDQHDCSRVMVEAPMPEFEPSTITREELGEAMLTSPANLHPDLPLLRHDLMCFVPFVRLDTLLNLYPDFRRLSRLGLEHETAGFACFTTEVVEDGSHWHMRFFAPGMGVSEDPVTGAAQGSLGVYLLEQGVIAAEPGQVGKWIGEQGDALERRGRVRIELSLNESGGVSQVRIGGPAVTVAQGRLRIG